MPCSDTCEFSDVELGNYALLMTHSAVHASSAVHIVSSAVHCGLAHASSHNASRLFIEGIHLQSYCYTRGQLTGVQMTGLAGLEKSSWVSASISSKMSQTSPIVGRASGSSCWHATTKSLTFWGASVGRMSACSQRSLVGFVKVQTYRLNRI